MLNLTPKFTKLTCEHVKNFPVASPRTPFKRQGREGKEGENRGGEERRGWDGTVREGASPK
jgi:hypothetical protein